MSRWALRRHCHGAAKGGRPWQLRCSGDEAPIAIRRWTRLVLADRRVRIFAVNSHAHAGPGVSKSSWRSSRSLTLVKQLDMGQSRCLTNAHFRKKAKKQNNDDIMVISCFTFYLQIWLQSVDIFSSTTFGLRLPLSIWTTFG